MSELYLDEILDLKNSLHRRKRHVEDQIAELNKDKCDCARKPDCPRCVLDAELIILGRYIDHLEREAYYEGVYRHGND